MTTRIPDDRRPTVRDLAMQVLRYWRDSTIMIGEDGHVGLVLADVLVPGSDSFTGKAALYAGPLPERARRLSPAVGMEYIAPVQRSDPLSPVSSYAFSLECRSATRDGAVAVLNDFVRVFRPREQPFVWTPTDDGGAFDRRGVIGPPLITTGAPVGPMVWRVIGIDVDDVFPQALADSPQSHDGSGSALLNIVVHAAPCGGAGMPAPLPVLDVWHPDSDAGVGEAQARVAGVRGAAARLELRTRVTAGSGAWAVRSIDLATTATIAELAHAVNAHADAWEAEIAIAYQPTVLLRAPSPVLDIEPWPGPGFAGGERGWRAARGTGNKAQVRIWG